MLCFISLSLSLYHSHTLKDSIKSHEWVMRVREKKSKRNEKDPILNKWGALIGNHLLVRWERTTRTSSSSTTTSSYWSNHINQSKKSNLSIIWISSLVLLTISLSQSSLCKEEKKEEGGRKRRREKDRKKSNNNRYLVDPASSHMLVSKIKPCTCKYKQLCTCETANGSLNQ